MRESSTVLSVPRGSGSLLDGEGAGRAAGARPGGSRLERALAAPPPGTGGDRRPSGAGPDAADPPPTPSPATVDTYDMRVTDAPVYQYNAR